MTACDDFSKQGVLANVVKDFTLRESQREMAQAVTLAIQQQGLLAVEAGTGTGKTYAYLVPALRSGGKVVISTASKALQDQLYQRDLPTIAAALNFKGRVVVLKGRSNYLCLQRLEQQSSQPTQVSKHILADMMALRQWATTTPSGDISDCSSVAEKSAIWPLVTSSNDNCLGTTCAHYQACFVVKARQHALEADVVIINHHLFFADRAVKEEGYARLIPPAAVVILDEAHSLPEIAAHYFGESLSSRQLSLLAKDLRFSHQNELPAPVPLKGTTLLAGADRLSHTLQRLQVVLGEAPRRTDWCRALEQAPVPPAIAQLQEALEQCQHLLNTLPKRSALLENALERTVSYLTDLQRIQQVEIAGYSYWYQATATCFTLALTPLSVAIQFQALMKAQRSAWIFTSATLAVNQQIDYFSQQLGLKDPVKLLLASPFDYQQQALLCTPRYLPSTHQPAGAEQLAQMLSPLIENCGGGCFFLCTSYHRMQALANAFRVRLTQPILVQGESSKNALLEQFTHDGHALLLATTSFWQGIDVPGAALSCVIIDKLPFSVPDDPLLQARSADCRKQGGDPFIDLQIPEAVIALKQGVGRLIRTISDRGVLIICDDRLVTRSYGALFLNSLPPIPRTRDLKHALDFFR